jgi:hypothetical protein
MNRRPKSILTKVGLLIGTLLLVAAGYFYWRLFVEDLPGFDRSQNVFDAETLATLPNPERFTLLALEPAGADPQRVHPTNIFHQYEILGRSQVEDRQVQAQLFQSLQKSLMKSRGEAHMCFSPRHGIKAEKGTNYVDLVICFQCYQMAVYFSPGKERWFLITDSPKNLFDSALREYKLPISAN